MMLTLAALVDWLPTVDPELINLVAAGAIDGNQEKYVGIYNASSQGQQRICLGGLDCTRYAEKSITILIHWTNSATAAEEKAQALYMTLQNINGGQIDNIPIVSLNLGGGPIPVGRDVKGIYEYVINARILYERI